VPDCGAKAPETHAQSRDLAAKGPETNANIPDLLMCNANHHLACGLTNKGLKIDAFRDQFGRFRFSVARLRDRFGHFRGAIVRNRAQSVNFAQRDKS
jgi:hypothetical protein